MLVSKQFLQVCQISKESEGVSGNHLLIWHGMTQHSPDKTPNSFPLRMWCIILLHYFEVQVRLTALTSRDTKLLPTEDVMYHIAALLWDASTRYSTHQPRHQTPSHWGCDVSYCCITLRCKYALQHSPAETPNSFPLRRWCIILLHYFEVQVHITALTSRDTKLLPTQDVMYDIAALLWGASTPYSTHQPRHQTPSHWGCDVSYCCITLRCKYTLQNSPAETPKSFPLRMWCIILLHYFEVQVHVTALTSRDAKLLPTEDVMYHIAALLWGASTRYSTHQPRRQTPSHWGCDVSYCCITLRCKYTLQHSPAETPNSFPLRMWCIILLHYFEVQVHITALTSRDAKLLPTEDVMYHIAALLWGASTHYSTHQPRRQTPSHWGCDVSYCCITLRCKYTLQHSPAETPNSFPLRMWCIILLHYFEVQVHVTALTRRDAKLLPTEDVMYHIAALLWGASTHYSTHQTRHQTPSHWGCDVSYCCITLRCKYALQHSPAETPNSFPLRMWCIILLHYFEVQVHITTLTSRDTKLLPTQDVMYHIAALLWGASTRYSTHQTRRQTPSHWGCDVSYCCITLRCKYTLQHSPAETPNSFPLRMWCIILLHYFE